MSAVAVAYSCAEFVAYAHAASAQTMEECVFRCVCGVQCHWEFPCGTNTTYVHNVNTYHYNNNVHGIMVLYMAWCLGR